MSNRIARVRWEMGQALLPEHFVAQEDALLGDSIARYQLNGLPGYGVSELKLNENLLEEGVFSINKMTLVMNSGLLLMLPGNVSVSPFNLNVQGTAEVVLYCHVLHNTNSDEGSEDSWDEVENDSVPGIVYKLVLSSEQNHPDAYITMKLAEFVKDPEGIWTVSDNYIPPMLQVGMSVFLSKQLDELTEVLELFQYNLTIDAASYLSGDSLFSVKQCLKAVYKIQRFLAGLKSRINVHPYHVYEALQDLYIEVCFYKNIFPEHVTSPYEHDKLSECFGKIIISLIEQMQAEKTKSTYLPFGFKDGVFNIKLPEKIGDAKEVYLLVQKSHVNVTVPSEHIKLAGFSRLALVHKMALQGIPVKKTDRPSFQHAFGPEVDFFLITEGEEWDHAIREMSVAFYHHPDFADMEFYIYWR